MALLQNAKFVISANHFNELPEDTGYEIAFAGRSNAGKSSAINTLSNQTRLAYVSKQPGRTQLINFFRIDDESRSSIYPAMVMPKFHRLSEIIGKKLYLDTFRSEKACLV